MLKIGYIINKLSRNHIYKIIVIHWISYQPFEQQVDKFNKQPAILTLRQLYIHTHSRTAGKMTVIGGGVFIYSKSPF